MMIMMRIAVCALAMMAPLALVSSGADELKDQGNACLSDWSKAGPIVRERALTPPKDVKQLAEGNVPGRLLKMTLCADKGRFVYRLVIFAESGKLKKVTVDAKRPFKE